MEFNVVFSYKKQKKCVADWIIFMLSYEWPLSTKALHQRLTQRYGIFVSYQAVQKYMKIMLNEKVLLRESFYYKLNTEWLESIRKQISSVKRNYSMYDIKRNGFCKRYIN